MKGLISKRLTGVPVSAIRKLTPYAEAAKADGVKVYHLNIGDPDVKTPDVMIDFLHSFSANPIRYTNAKGEPELIDALLSYYHKLGHTFLNRQDLLVTIGGSEALLFVYFAIAEANEEILVFEPYYSNYATLASFAHVNLKAVPTNPLDGFHLPERKVIESAITAKTKAILICTPGNPTGTVYTKKEMETLVSIAKKHNLFLISDEVYREFVYDAPHTSLLTYVREIPDQAILLDSLSKRYSLCGARIGIVATLNKECMAGLIKLAQGRLSGGLIDQKMAATLKHVPQSWLDKVRIEYKKRRDTVYSEMSKIPGVKLTKPEGAFYTMATLPVDDAEKFCIFLLQKFRVDNETVMLAPGGGFYQTMNAGKNQVRIAYVLNVDDLKKSMRILRTALTEFNSIP